MMPKFKTQQRLRWYNIDERIVDVFPLDDPSYPDNYPIFQGLCGVCNNQMKLEVEDYEGDKAVCIITSLGFNTTDAHNERIAKLEFKKIEIKPNA